MIVTTSLTQRSAERQSRQMETMEGMGERRSTMFMSVLVYAYCMICACYIPLASPTYCKSSRSSSIYCHKEYYPIRDRARVRPHVCPLPEFYFSDIP